MHSMTQRREFFVHYVIKKHFGSKMNASKVESETCTTDWSNELIVMVKVIKFKANIKLKLNCLSASLFSWLYSNIVLRLYSAR